MNALKAFLPPAGDGDTLKHQKARKRILEALEALGYYLRFKLYTDRQLGLTTTPPFIEYDREVPWTNVPTSKGKKEDDVIQHAQGVSPHNHFSESTAGPAVNRANRLKYGETFRDFWKVNTRYFPYQELIVAGISDDLDEHPEFTDDEAQRTDQYDLNPTHILGAERRRNDDHRPNIFWNWEIKPCIWAYYTQVDPLILHVIADYFGVQIIVFTYDGDPYNQLDGVNNADVEIGRNIDPQRRLSDRANQFKARLFGHIPRTCSRPGEWLRFSPEHKLGNRVEQNGNPDLPWWRPPVPNAPNAPVPLERLDRLPCEDEYHGVPLSQFPYTARPPNPPPRRIWIPQDESVLDKAKFDLFMHGRDIPGTAHRGLPDKATTMAWRVHISAADSNIALPRAPDPKNQIRYGGLRDLPVEFWEDYSREFLWQHRYRSLAG
ncbi:hypothetical protein B0H63DRAFT_516486 [Podospora didyma]|uniref:Uncharacterized protein n=1 Tax=Podospora didyma TaxID=330526 RepID=A0AAE0P4Q7_9PEZI|nr:hypothetical protein B0H63DRAFT_516486 [Podospora didyma]